jgi:hypothetical protein
LSGYKFFPSSFIFRSKNKSEKSLFSFVIFFTVVGLPTGHDLSLPPLLPNRWKWREPWHRRGRLLHERVLHISFVFSSLFSSFSTINRE